MPILRGNDLKKLQQIELEMLSEFDKICRKHNLKYCLCGGTLLGAIRHKGFIPWDDDIDIMMPKEDYDKFLTIQAKELNSKKYYFQCLENDEDYMYLFAKIRRKDSIYREKIVSLDKEKQGIWIDIFPLYKTSDNDFYAKIIYLRIVAYKIMLGYKLKNKIIAGNIIKHVIGYFLHFLSLFYSKKRLRKNLFSLINKYNKKDTKNRAAYSLNYILNGFFKYDIFDEVIEHEFENRKFYVPKNYDQFLTQCYGDYMKLPPKDQQISNHEVLEFKFPKENKK